jgi:thioredoxin reductase (NADPH)
MHRPPFEAVRIVGEQWDAYGHGLQDALQRSGVPFRFYDAGSTDGRELLQVTAQSGPLPVAILFDGRVLAKPTPAEIADALGVNTDAGSEVFDVTAVACCSRELSRPVTGATYFAPPLTLLVELAERWGSIEVGSLRPAPRTLDGRC